MGQQIEGNVSPDTDVNEFSDIQRKNCNIIHSQYIRGRENEIETFDEYDLPEAKPLRNVSGV